MFRLASLFSALVVGITSAAPNECVIAGGLACGTGPNTLYTNDAHNCDAITGVSTPWCCKGTDWNQCGTVCDPVGMALMAGRKGDCAICTGTMGPGCLTGGGSTTGCLTCNGSTCGAGLTGTCAAGGGAAAASSAWQKASLGLLAIAVPFVAAA